MTVVGENRHYNQPPWPVDECSRLPEMADMHCGDSVGAAAGGWSGGW